MGLMFEVEKFRGRYWVVVFVSPCQCSLMESLLKVVGFIKVNNLIKHLLL